MVQCALTSAAFEAPRGKRRRGTRARRARPATDEIAFRRLDYPASFCFTSGTGGEPRGVVLTHGNFFWSALGSARNLGVRPKDLWLSCLPLHHVGGLSILTRSAYYGTAALLHDRFDADAVNEAIDSQGVTLLSLVPPMLERLLRARRGRLVPTSVRAALVGGGPIPVQLLEEAAEIRLRALPTYGLTEATSQVTTLSLREWPVGLASAGRPLPFVQVELRDPSGQPVQRGEEGEIFVRGPTVMAAYFEDRDAEATAWQGRWLKTGDVGVWDPAGRLVVLDRRLDRITVGGENVSPREVERVLLEHSEIADACVVGIPSGSWGHEVAAAIVLRGVRGLSLEELREYAGASLSPFKIPRRLLVLGEIPRGAAGKPLRRVVRDRFRDEVLEEKPA